MTVRFSINCLKKRYHVDFNERGDKLGIWVTSFHIKWYKIRTSKYGRYIMFDGCVYLLDE